MPTRVRSRGDGSRVLISCLVSDIDLTVSLAPHPRGCAVELAVRLPESESGRLEGMRRLAVDSLARLAARTSAPGLGGPPG